MASKLEIANRSLDAIGDEGSLLQANLDTSGTNAKALTILRHWDAALHELLREYHWSWAKTRADITRTYRTLVNGSFVMPAVGATVNVTFDSTSGFTAGDTLIVGTEQWFEVTSVTNGTVAVLENLGGHSNANPGETVADNSTVYEWDGIEPDFGWDWSFPLPSDFLSVVGVNEDYVSTPSDLWEIESGRLLIDDSAADLEYIYFPSDTATDTFLAGMDPLALNALVTLLASKIATRLAKDGRTLALSLTQQYLQTDLPRARVKAANEQKAAPRLPGFDSQSLAARRAYANP